MATRWRSEYLPLGRGPFTGRLAIAHTANVQIALVECSQGYSFRGDLPPGAYTFLMPLYGMRGVVFLGREIADLDIMAAKHEAVYFSPFGNKRLVISAAYPLLDDAIGSVWLQGDYDTSQRQFRFIDHDYRLEFLEGTQRLLADLLKNPGMLKEYSSAVLIERRLIENFLQASSPNLRIPSMAERHRIAIRARDFMIDRVHGVVSTAELCASVNLSMRALLLGFQETYGAAPIRYLRRVRLNGARRELRAGGDISVSQVAARWGFLHFGRFSTEYNLAFGEKPSETLYNRRAVVIPV